MNDEFYWPESDEHVAVVGRNGTGKSQLGFFITDLRHHLKSTTIILDYKREKLFKMLKNARYIFPRDKLPKEPGVYIAQARFKTDDDEVEDMLTRILDRERINIVVDEGYMLPNNGQSPAYMGILTQGRSKRIPAITLSQRPVKVHSFAFSEASHIAVFDLNRKRDRQTIEENTEDDFVDWLPDEFAETGLPRFHSRWFTVKNQTRKTFIVRPVPPAEEIAASLDAKLKPVRTWF